MLYIVASMEPELAGLRRELDALEPPRGAKVPVEFHFVGVGPRRAGAAMTEILRNSGLKRRSRRRPEAVLMLGVAGAVNPGMQSGDLILADTYALDAEGDRVNDIAPDPGMLETAEATAAELRMPVSRASSLTVDHLIVESSERQQLRDKYGVASVNMEDHAVAVAASKAGVPFISVRVILDTAEQRLPGYLPGLSKKRNAAFTEILLKPWRIPTLWKLKSQMDLCQTVLTRFGLSYLEREAERQKRHREKVASEALY